MVSVGHNPGLLDTVFCATMLVLSGTKCMNDFDLHGVFPPKAPTLLLCTKERDLNAMQNFRGCAKQCSPLCLLSPGVTHPSAQPAFSTGCSEDLEGILGIIFPYLWQMCSIPHRMLFLLITAFIDL